MRSFHRRRKRPPPSSVRASRGRASGGEGDEGTEMTHGDEFQRWLGEDGADARRADRWAYDVVGSSAGGANSRRMTLWRVTADAMSGQKSMLLKKFDAAVTRRVCFLFGNVLFSLAVMLAWNQSSGDGDAIGSNRFDLNTGISKTFIEIVLLVQTLVMMACTIEYYLHQRRFEGRSWHHLDSRQWAVWRWGLLAVELCVMVVHPFPGCSNYFGRIASTFMFLRVYTICRVIRNLSASYRARDQIMRSRAFRMAGSVQFSWAFCFRILFMSNPWVVVIIAVAYSILTVAYSFYIFERVTETSDVSSPWTYRTAVWCTVITMTTVGYGDEIPWSQEGRIVASVAALIGVVLASILIFVIINALTPSLLERHAHTIRKARWWSARLEYLSIRYVQLWVRFFLWKRNKGPPVPHFESRNSVLKAKIRGIRRKIALLEIDTIKAVEELELAKIDEDGAGHLAGIIGGAHGDDARVIDNNVIDSGTALNLGLGDIRSRAQDFGGFRAGSSRADAHGERTDRHGFDDDVDGGSARRSESRRQGNGRRPRALGGSAEDIEDLFRGQRDLREAVHRIERNQEMILDLLNNSRADEYSYGH